MLLGGLGVEPHQGFLDQPVELAEADLVREAGHVPVDVLRTLGRQADGALRDPAGSPGGELAGLDPRPHPRQPVGELERVGDQGSGRIVRDVQDGGELGHAELTDLRDALAGEAGRLLEQQRGGRVVDLVHRRPLPGELEDPDLLAVRGRASLTHGSQNRVGGVRLPLGCRYHCHAPIGSGATDSFRTLVLCRLAWMWHA